MVQITQNIKRIRAVAIIVKDDKILLIHRISHGKEYHVFPGGGVENGETIEQAVLREVQEEASLEVKIEKLLYHHIYDDNTEQFFYLCRCVSGEPKLGDGNEARGCGNNSLHSLCHNHFFDAHHRKSAVKIRSEP